MLDLLEEQSLSPAHLVHLNVYLSSQSHFATLNKIYSSYFGVDPPSRACVGINLEDSLSCHLLLDATASDDGINYSQETKVLSNSFTPSRSRKVLHIQSRSYWAAANIGPYSQSVNAHGRITISGQIGLLPTTLQLASPIPLQITLALQHARRVFKATLEGRAEKQQGWIEGCICWVDDANFLVAARNAWQAQKSRDEDEASWESEWLGQGRLLEMVPVTYLVLPSKGLPRSATVEWQLFAHDGRSVVSEEDDDGHDDDDKAHPPVLQKDAGSFGNFSATWNVTASKKGASTLGIAHLNKTFNPSGSPLSSLLSTALSLKVLYYRQDFLEERKSLQILTVILSNPFTLFYILQYKQAQRHCLVQSPLFQSVLATMLSSNSAMLP